LKDTHDNKKVKNPMLVGKNEEEKKEKQFLQKLKSIFTHGLEQKYHEIIIIMTKMSALNC
jgi:hypothetical protein